MSSTAETSRATPYTARQSGRFDVISSSSTWSVTGNTSASGVPAARSPGSSMIPSCSWESSSSRSDRIMPSDSRPRSFAFFSTTPPGSVAPGNTTATVAPASKLRAPQTIWRGSPSPTSTMHSESRSAFGCCSRDTTLPTR